MGQSAASGLDQAGSARGLATGAGLEALVAAMPCPVWVGAATGECVLANAAWQEASGQSAGQALGLGWLEAVPPGGRDAALGAFVDAVAQGGATGIELRFCRPDGSEQALRAAVRPLPAVGEDEPLWVVTAEPAPPAFGPGVHRQVLDSLFAFVGVMTPDGTLIDVNRAPLEAGGLTESEVLGKKAWECPWLGHDPAVQSQLREASARAAAGKASRSDVVVRMPGRRLMTIDFMIAPLRDERGVITYLIISGVDVTDRVRAETALRESEALALRQLAEIRATYDTAPVGMCVIDTDLRWVRINNRLAEMNGYPAEAHIGRTIGELLPDLAPQAERMLRTILETGRPVLDMEVEGETPARPGERRTWVESFFPIRDAAGTMIGINVVCEEVTERKRAQESLRASMERTSLALAAGRMGIWEWDVTTDRVTCSDEMFELLRVRREDFRPSLECFLHVVHPVDRTATAARLRGVLDGGSEYEDRFRVVRGDGRVRWVQSKGLVRRDHRGNPLGVIGICSDQTDRIEAEAALKWSERRHRRLINANVIGIVVWKATGEIEEANEAFLSLLGFDRADLDEGRVRWDLLTPSEYRAADARSIERLRTTGVSPPHEKGFYRKDGQVVPVLVSAASFDEGGGESGLAFVVDITDRKRAEAAIRDSDRRKTEFLAVLSHELRNPLAALRNALRIGGPGAPEADRHWALEVIDRQSRQLATLIDDLLDVNRVDQGKVTLRRRPLVLCDVLANAVEAIRPAVVENGHTLRFDRAPFPLVVDADPARLEQVVINLLSNAVKYTPPGGHIALDPRREGDEAVVSVRDTGVGIAPEMLPRVFELFTQAGRSLDRSQGGLGIGLSLARSLVELHGGRIEVHSAGPGKGSEFTVRLPLGSDPADRLAPAAQAAPASVGSAAAPAPASDSSPLRLLLVDDNVDSAQALARFLRRLGHEVRVAHDGPAALGAVSDARPDVVILDIGMPGMDGYQVAERIRGADPTGEIRLVALSGFAREDDHERSRRAGFGAHLVKPVDVDRLVEILAQARTAQPRGRVE